LVGAVPLSELLFFFRQLATMLEAGVPYVQSLDTLAGQGRDPKLKSIILELKGHVEVGRPMSVGMQRYPEVFTPVMMSMLRAGEEGGFLDQALATIATYVEKDLALRTMYKRVTFYPKLEVAGSIVIILIANMIITAVGGTAYLWSPLTQIATWFILGPLIVAYYLFSRVGLANPRVKYNYDAVVANMPYVGGIMRQLAMARFGRALGALHRGGVPIHRSVELASDACGNEWLRSKMVPAPKQLESGAGVSETLSETGAFSPIVMNMVSTGEQTGNLDKMVDKMADYYEDESETKAMQLAKIVGFVLTLLVCIYIGIIVINFWTTYGQGLKPE
jgi:type II secretory pathway component PulF